MPASAPDRTPFTATSLPLPAFLSLNKPVALTATLSPCTTPFSVPVVAASREPSYTLPAAVSAPVIAFGVIVAVVVALEATV
ncbi:hypothetical protein D3C78_1656620 [compost metagenome]